MSLELNKHKNRNKQTNMTTNKKEFGAYLGWELGKDYPEWANTLPYVETISKGYLYKNETPREAYQRVSNSVAQYLGKPELADKFFQYIWNGWLCLATPVLINTGTDRGLPISCYGASVGDSVYSIGAKNLEMMVMAKSGGGVGLNMSNIRPAGSLITDNGSSDGIVPFCKIYDSTILATSQGSSRRGSAVINLNIDHDDFEDWLEIREPKGDVNRQSLNLHQCAVITDDFMRRLEAGDEIARRKWSKLLYKRKHTGEPYCLWIDAVNRANPKGYKDRDLKVSMTNLCCFTGDVEVRTINGSVPIKDLVGKKVEIWDGKRWVKNNQFQLVNAKCTDIWEVELENGTKIKCTGNHRWFVVNESPNINNQPYLERLTTELNPGDLLESHSFGLEEHGANNKGFYVIKSVTKLEVVKAVDKLDSIEQPVYCTTVPSTSKFALSCGVMTGNSEITLYTDVDHSFVCCLSSLNLAKYHEWKDTDLVETAIWFLDGVMSEFIDKAKEVKGMECAVRFSEKSRALGLGVLGWNTFLQQEGLPFDSKEANQWTVTIFKQMKEQAYKASQDLAKEYGEPEWCQDTGMRNSHTCATAPTVSNSKLSGEVSPGIEPWAANIFNEQSAKGNFIRKNKVLKGILQQIGIDNDATWLKIMSDGGSVQGVDELDGWYLVNGILTNTPADSSLNSCYTVKEVFKTFAEINQIKIVHQQGIRQQYIDQSVSLNLKFPADASPKFINQVHLEAWKMGLKTLYYMRSESVLKADTGLTTMPTCQACDG